MTQLTPSLSSLCCDWVSVLLSADVNQVTSDLLSNLTSLLINTEIKTEENVRRTAVKPRGVGRASGEERADRVYNGSEHALDVCECDLLTGLSETLPLVSVPTATRTTRRCFIVVFLTNFKSQLASIFFLHAVSCPTVLALLSFALRFGRYTFTWITSHCTFCYLFLPNTYFLSMIPFYVNPVNLSG